MFSSCISITEIANRYTPLAPRNYSPVNSINVQLDNLYFIVFTIPLGKYIHFFLILKIVFEEINKVVYLLHHKYKIKQ